MHSEVAYFAKEAVFHEALDQLTSDQRNSLRIMMGCAADANDLNVLERSSGRTMEFLSFCVLFEIPVLLMLDTQCKGVLSCCGLEFCWKIYCKLISKCVFCKSAHS